MQTTIAYIYPIGTLAYFDSFAGLVPCKVIGVDGWRVKIRITANRGPYKKGEITTSNSIWVPPRQHVRQGEFSSFIQGNWKYA